MEAKKVLNVVILLAVSMMFLSASSENIPVDFSDEENDMRSRHSEEYVPTSNADDNSTELPETTESGMAFSLSPEEVTVKVGEAFVIQTAISNAANMYAWQVYLIFDPAILQCINVSLPPDHVFLNAYTTCDLLTEYNRTQFAKPLHSIKNDMGRVLAFDCLFNYEGSVYEDGRLLKGLGAGPNSFNGSGNLCQLEFRAIASGSANITLITDPDHVFQTYVANPDLKVATTSTNYSCNVYVQS